MQFSEIKSLKWSTCRSHERNHCIVWPDSIVKGSSNNLFVGYSKKCSLHFLKRLYTTEAGFLSKTSNAIQSYFEPSFLFIPFTWPIRFLVKTISITITFLEVLQEGSSNKQTAVQISQY